MLEYIIEFSGQLNIIDIFNNQIIFVIGIFVDEFTCILLRKVFDRRSGRGWWISGKFS
jgi:hypothetical protein